MKSLFRYGAVASIFLLTAGSAAFAQSSGSNSGSDWNQGRSWNQGAGSGGGWNQGMGSGWNQDSGGSGWNQGSGGHWNQGGFSGGGQGWNQDDMRSQGGHRHGGWTQGSGSSQPGGSQQTGMQGRDWNGPSAQDAWQQLSRYGYQNIAGMERSEGWQARATRNGQRVFVFIDDDGMVATYAGNGQF